MAAVLDIALRAVASAGLTVGISLVILSPDVGLGTEGFTPAGVADVGESGLAVGLVVPT